MRRSSGFPSTKITIYSDAYVAGRQLKANGWLVAALMNSQAEQDQAHQNLNDHNKKTERYLDEAAELLGYWTHLPGQPG